MGKQFLVTVGTTKFENLVKSIDFEEFYTMLDKHNFDRLIIQKGFGEYIPHKYSHLKLRNLTVQIESLISNFEDVINNSDVIISHGGAGNILEALKYHKKLFVVVNDLLMDNHQIELAEALSLDNYIYYVKKTENIINDVKNVLENEEQNILNEYPDFNLDVIPNLIYEMLEI